MMSIQPIALVVAVVFATLLAAFVLLAVFALHRSFRVGVAVAALLFAFEAIVPGSPGVSLGIRLYPADLVALLVAAATLLRVMSRREARPTVPVWYLFIAVFVASFVIGSFSNGTAAGVSGRPYFYAIVMTGYAMSFPGDRAMVKTLLDAMAALSLVLLALVGARWIITFVPIGALLPASGRFASSDASVLRVIPSFEAFLLAQTGLLCLFYSQASRSLGRLRVALPALLGTVLVLQHRSVWLAFCAGVAARMAIPLPGGRVSIQMLLLIVGAVVAYLGLLASGFGGTLLAEVGESARRVVVFSDTASARLDTWRFMLEKWVGGGPRAWLIGLPFGESVDRLQRTSTGEFIRIGFGAHNHYVQTVFNLGLAGLLLNLALYAIAIRGLLRARHEASMTTEATALLMLVVTQMVYYLPYGVDTFQSLVLGVAIAIGLSCRESANQGSAILGRQAA